MAAWDPDSDRRLRDLWKQGVTTVLIGQAMGISKNAVIGRAHRLDLPLRASPIKPRVAVAPSAVLEQTVRGADLTGQRFGSRVVLGRAAKVPGCKQAYWTVRCDCGRVTDVQAFAIRGSRMCGACSRAANAPVNPRKVEAPVEVQAEAVETNVVQLPVSERWFVTQPTPVAPRFQPTAKAAVSQAGPGPARSCQYPLTDARPWRFCGEVSVPGLSWCGCHAARVFVQKRQASEVAA